MRLGSAVPSRPSCGLSLTVSGSPDPKLERSGIGQALPRFTFLVSGSGVVEEVREMSRKSSQHSHTHYLSPHFAQEVTGHSATRGGCPPPRRTPPASEGLGPDLAANGSEGRWALRVLGLSHES